MFRQDEKCAHCRPFVTVTVIDPALEIPENLRRAHESCFFSEADASRSGPIRPIRGARGSYLDDPHNTQYRPFKTVLTEADKTVIAELQSGKITKEENRRALDKQKRQNVDMVAQGYIWDTRRNKWVPPKKPKVVPKLPEGAIDFLGLEK